MITLDATMRLAVRFTLRESKRCNTNCLCQTPVKSIFCCFQFRRTKKINANAKKNDLKKIIYSKGETGEKSTAFPAPPFWAGVVCG